MKKTILISLVLITGVIVFFSFKSKLLSDSEKINGVSFVAPPREIGSKEMSSMKSIGAGWVAIIPYAFSGTGMPEVTFNYPRQWWGERVEGASRTIQYAQQLGLKVMIKPHVWVRGQGWPGDYDLKTNEEWERWERSYRSYIITYAHVADSLKVDLLCIGTEYRKAVVKRPEFWKSIIKEVKEIYNGKITYAANWDNYENVTFWKDLDYIGIDGYFPLSSSKTPAVEEMNKAWGKLKPAMKRISEENSKPILFTEYGYESIDYSTYGHWNYQKDTVKVNMTAQANAYESLYQSLWDETWFAGGFLWKWHANDSRYGGPDCKRYTPQNKPVEAIIKKWYEQKESLP